MPEALNVRDSGSGDAAAIEALYPRAFPDEDLLPLVRELLADRVDVLSLVGIIDDDIVGHAVFTTCGIVDTDVDVAMLGPVAVDPERQRQGIGSILIRTGIRKLEEANFKQILVLGDPEYYGRFGFLPGASVEPPYPLPPEWNYAWQSLALGGSTTPGNGKLSVPAPWHRPALWGP